MDHETEASGSPIPKSSISRLFIFGRRPVSSSTIFGVHGSFSSRWTKAPQLFRMPCATRWRDECARGCRILDDTTPRGRQAHHLACPVNDHFLELTQGGARLPRQADDSQSGAQVVAEHAREHSAGRKVAKEAWMLPVREARRDDLINVLEDGVERFWRCRWRCWQARLDVSGRAPQGPCSACQGG